MRDVLHLWRIGVRLACVGILHGLFSAKGDAARGWGPWIYEPFAINIGLAVPNQEHMSIDHPGNIVCSSYELESKLLSGGFNWG